MSNLPYLPAGGEDLPAERFIVFADNAGDVQVLDESEKTAAGVSFTSFWSSQSLNRKQRGRVDYLNALTLLYSAEATTTLTVQFSPDGGETWPLQQVAVIEGTGGTRSRRVTVPVFLAGFDLRFRIIFDTDILINVMGYIPSIPADGPVKFSEVE